MFYTTVTVLYPMYSTGINWQLGNALWTRVQWTIATLRQRYHRYTCTKAWKNQRGGELHDTQMCMNIERHLFVVMSILCDKISVHWRVSLLYILAYILVLLIPLQPGNTFDHFHIQRLLDICIVQYNWLNKWGCHHAHCWLQSSRCLHYC